MCGTCKCKDTTFSPRSLGYNNFDCCKKKFGSYDSFGFGYGYGYGYIPFYSNDCCVLNGTFSTRSYTFPFENSYNYYGNCCGTKYGGYTRYSINGFL